MGANYPLVSGTESPGSPSTLYVATDAYANLLLLSLTTGQEVWCTNGAGFPMRWTGSVLATKSYPDATKPTALVSASGVVTLDCHSGYKRFELTTTENITSWSVTNPPPAGYYRDLEVSLTRSGSYTVVSPATSGKTAGGVAWAVQAGTEILGMRIHSDSTITLFPAGLQV